MIIHINQTLQSYLVHEKKMIYFLKHAGVTKPDVDMNIQRPLLADTKPAPRADSWQSSREASVGRLSHGAPRGRGWWLESLTS